MRDKALVHKINPSTDLTVGHIVQFVDIWVRILGIQLQMDVDDDITWKFEANEDTRQALLIWHNSWAPPPQS